jgi:hypothetical protein
VTFGRPTANLEEKLAQDARGVEDVKTRSSNNSAFALHLFTDPFNPDNPGLNNMARRLNFDANMDSRNTMRGYAIGTPVLIFSFTRSDNDKRSGVTELYNEMLDPAWQLIQSIEDFNVLIIATHLVKISFRSAR